MADSPITLRKLKVMTSMSLTQFATDVEGLELVINKETGECFSSQRALARMCEVDEKTIRKFIGADQINTFKAEVQTPGGLQGATLISEEFINKAIIKYNPDLAFRCMQAGLRLYLHRMAGYHYQVNPFPEIDPDPSDYPELMRKLDLVFEPADPNQAPKPKFESILLAARFVERLKGKEGSRRYLLEAIARYHPQYLAQVIREEIIPPKKVQHPTDPETIALMSDYRMMEVEELHASFRKQISETGCLALIYLPAAAEWGLLTPKERNTIKRKITSAGVNFPLVSRLLQKRVRRLERFGLED